HTQTSAPVAHGWELPRAATGRALTKRHYRSQDLGPKRGPPVDARVPLLFNEDVTLSIMQPDAADPVFFSNGDADELFFVREGGGTLRSALGDLRFEKEDYLAIPRGLAHRLLPDAGTPQIWLSIECLGGLHLPR